MLPSRTLQRSLLRTVTGRFLGFCVGFVILVLVYCGGAAIFGWLYDRDACLAGLSIGGYCILDSFFLTGLATIGAGLAPFFLKFAWSSVATFFGQAHSILTWRADELAQYGHEILGRSPEVKE